MPDLIERLRNRRESVYDYATQGAEWQDDALCSEAASRITALEKENAAMRDALRDMEAYCAPYAEDFEEDHPVTIAFAKTRTALRDGGEK